MAKNGNIHPTRIFKSPEELLAAWNNYLKDLETESLKWYETKFVGKDAEETKVPYKLPYTQDGFEVFCYKNYGCVNQYFDNKDGLYDDFVTICKAIKQEIRANQITGGLLGLYNPSITQRLNNLVEQQSLSVTEVKPIEFTIIDANTNTPS
jgi:hypothetical protein